MSSRGFAQRFAPIENGNGNGGFDICDIVPNAPGCGGVGNGGGGLGGGRFPVPTGGGSPFGNQPEDIFCILFPALCGLPGGPSLPGVPEAGDCGSKILVERRVGGFPPVMGGDGKPCCPKNHKLGFNKKGDLCCKRIRRMNPFNPAANRRATRRLTSFVKGCDRSRAALSKLAPPRRSRRAPAAKKCCS